jgi:hypothetical protein
MNLRPSDREDRQVAGLWALCAVLALGLRPLWLAAAGFAPPCLWHAWTGWPCPGCGSTRTLVRLLHADLPGAFRLNPLVAVAAALFVLAGLLAPVWLALGGPAVSVVARPRPGWVAAFAALFLANWAWLCASGV